MSEEQKQTVNRFLSLLRPIESELEIFCRRMIWNPQEASDAIQNAVLRAYGAFDRYHDDASFRAWMFKILTHEIFALNRKHSRRARHEFQLEPVEMEELPALQTPSSETDWLATPAALIEALDENLVEALKTLTETERAVLLLRAVGEFRYAEIAEALVIPLGSVMGDLSRARLKMRSALRRSQSKTAL